MNAAFSAVLSFWPALKRPCGAGLRPVSQRRSSRSKPSISRAVRDDPAPVAGEHDQREHADPGDPRPEVEALDERPAADGDREARQVEDEPGREQEEEEDRVRPVERPLGAREPPAVAALHVPYPFERPTQASRS